MRNHIEKTRDMARSSLPSTRRRSARNDKRTAKQRSRHKVRRALHEWKSCADPYDYEGFADHQPIYGWGEENIKVVVDERRNGDKLSVVRWAKRLCETKLADLDEVERYYYFKRVMPDTLPGRHALGHIESEVCPILWYLRHGGYGLRWLIEDEDGFLREMTDQERADRYAKEREEQRREQVEKALLVVETHGAQSRFNDYMKADAWQSHRRRCTLYSHAECDVQPRLLTGYGDIEAFVAECGYKLNMFEV